MMNLETCVQLIRENFPHIDIRNATHNTQGWDSYVVDINGEYIFRFPHSPQTEAVYEAEKHLLDSLAPHLSVQVPRFEFDCRVEGQAFGRFVGYRKIIGEPLSRERITEGNRTSLAQSIGKALSELHSFPVSEAIEAGFKNQTPAQWKAERTDLYQRIQTEVLDMLDAPTRAYVEGMWKNYIENPASLDFTPAFVHQDLGGVHILCDYQRGKVNGIIDWSDSTIGDPAIDFVGILIDCGMEFTRLVADNYTGEMKDSFWKRVQFYYDIEPFYEILYGLDTKQEGFVQSGITAVKERVVMPPS